MSVKLRAFWRQTMPEIHLEQHVVISFRSGRSTDLFLKFSSLFSQVQVKKVTGRS